MNANDRMCNTCPENKSTAKVLDIDNKLKWKVNSEKNQIFYTKN